MITGVVIINITLVVFTSILAFLDLLLLLVVFISCMLQWYVILKTMCMCMLIIYPFPLYILRPMFFYCQHSAANHTHGCFVNTFARLIPTLSPATCVLHSLSEAMEMQ